MTNLEIVNGLRIAMSEICKEYMYEQSCDPCPFYKCDTCLIQEAVNEIDVNILLDNGVEIVNEEAEEWKEKYKRLEEFVLSLTRLGKGGTNVEKLFGHYTITKTVLADKTGVEDLMEEGFWK